MKKTGILVLFLMGWIITANGQKPQGTSEINYYKSGNSTKIPTDRGTVLQGKKMFNSHCSECHEFCKQKTGPSLSSVTDRRPISWLTAFITSSQTVISNGDEYAQFLYKNYHNTVMPDFKFLSENDILTILSYIKSQSSTTNDVAGINSQSQSNTESKPDSSQAGLAQANLATDNHAEQGNEYEAKEKSFKIGMLIVVIGTLVVSISLIVAIWKKFSRSRNSNN